MADASSSRVTITLGRSGKVVKKAGNALNHPFPDSHPRVGSKRSVRDRLGTIEDSTTTHISNKRQRGDGSRLSYSASSGIDDAQLGKNDLRYKIMRKNIINRSQSNGQQTGVDLRDFLSRPAQSSTTTSSSRQRMPEPRDSRPRVSDTMSNRHRLVESRDSRQGMHEIRDTIEHIPETRDFRQHEPKLRDPRYHIPVTKSLSIPERVPFTRTDALSLMDSTRKSYSSWTSERQRSPDGGVRASRGPSPPRRGEELSRRPPTRDYDDPRLSSYTRRDVSESSRPIISASYLSNTTQPAGPAKTIAPMFASIPRPSNLVHKSSYAVEEQPTVDSLLHSLGLEKYSINFRAEEVDFYTLRQMGDNDLKALGIPMGPRKKILLSLMSRAKRQV